MIPPFVPAVPILAANAILSLPGVAASALTGRAIRAINDAFATFLPVSGGSVIDQQIATYSFANLKVAANSIIDQPKHISFQMIAPARGTLGYWLKLAEFTALITTLRMHNASGGSYILITPAYIYFDCLMRNMRDTSSGQTKQVQNVWTLDFEQPLLTLEDAESVTQTLNGILTGITNGQPPPVGAAGNPTAGV